MHIYIVARAVRNYVRNAKYTWNIVVGWEDITPLPITPSLMQISRGVAGERLHTITHHPIADADQPRRSWRETSHYHPSTVSTDSSACSRIV